MKTKKICLFVLLASIILVSKMVFAQNRSSLQQHITRKWTKEVINKASNPSLIEPPSIDFKPEFEPFKIPRYFDYPKSLDYPRYFNCPRPYQDYSYKRFPNIILPCNRENKDILMIPNTFCFSYNQSWEDMLLSYLETYQFKQSREILVQLKYDVIVRSGPGYNYDIVKKLKKDCYIRIASYELREGLYDWKNNKNEIMGIGLIRSQEVAVWERPEKKSRYKLWLELIEPEGWINIIDFLTADIRVQSNYQKGIDDKYYGNNFLNVNVFNGFNTIKNSNYNQEDNEDKAEVITLKRRTYVRSGPSRKNRVNRILLKGEKIWVDKNKITKAFKNVTIQDKKDEQWLELVRPKGWICLKDFVSDYEANSSRRRINMSNALFDLNIE